MILFGIIIVYGNGNGNGNDDWYVLIYDLVKSIFVVIFKFEFDGLL